MDINLDVSQTDDIMVQITIGSLYVGFLKLKDERVLVQRKLDKSFLRLRESLAFGKEVFLGIGEIAEIS